MIEPLQSASQKVTERNVDSSGSAQTSVLLAIVAGFGCVALCGLVFLGQAVKGELIDLFPCLLTATITPLVIQTAGRLSGKSAVLIPLFFAAAAVLLGKWLAWDLGGIVAQLSGAELPANVGWWETFKKSWNAIPVAVQRMNVALYLLTPVVAGGVVYFCRWLERRQPTLRSDPTSVQVPTVEFRSRRWLLALAGAWTVVVMLVHLTLTPPGRTGFLYFTLPFVPANQMNTLWGFAYMVDGSPVMSETLPAIEQENWFRGAVRSDNNFRFLRAGYAWLAATLFPWLHPPNSLIALNIMASLACLTCVWRLTARFYRDDFACCLATMLAAAGIGFSLHWNAATPHLVSFALYAIGLTMLVESKMLTQRRPWRVHLAFATYLGLVSLIYNVWLMLALVYVVCGVRRQRWRHLAAGLLVAGAFAPIWRCILPALGINLLDVEGDYLRRALSLWKEAAEAGIGNFVIQIVATMLEAITAMESPLLLLLGAVGLCCTIERGKRMFVLSAVAAPVLACTLFAPAASARGYIVYGSSCLWFMAAGRILAMALRARRLPRWTGAIAVGVVLATQLAWSMAWLVGYPGPAFTYLYGWDQGIALMQYSEPNVVSLTGQDEVPAFYRGTGTAETTHAYRVPASVPVERRSRILAYLSRLVFMLGVCLLLSAVIDNPARRQVGVIGGLMLMLAVTEISFRLPCHQTGFWDMQNALELPNEGMVTIRIEVSVELQARLYESLMHDNTVGSLFIPTSEECDVTWTIAGGEVSLSSIDRHEARCLDIAALAPTSQPVTWEITITNRDRDTQNVEGWQQLQTPGKSLTPAASATCLPAIEFRIRDASTGRLIWLGM